MNPEMKLYLGRLSAALFAIFGSTLAILAYEMYIKDIILEAAKNLVVAMGAALP